MAGNQDASRSAVGVKYPVPRLGVVRQQPFVEGNGLLGGVDALLFVQIVARILGW